MRYNLTKQEIKRLKSGDGNLIINNKLNVWHNENVLEFQKKYGTLNDQLKIIDWDRN